jgi:hypothetical protein
MMYSQKLVACVKVDGKILRESGDSVTIPFGSEYSVLIKNLNSVRVQVKVSVDGQDATEGTWLIVQPNASIELERFIRNGNLSRGNRFKFIERTGKIEQHRGIGSDDGLIRIEYKTEKVLPRPIHVPVVYDYYAWPNWWPYTYRPTWWGTPYVYGGVQYVCQNAPENLNDNVTFTTTSSVGSAQSGVFVGNMSMHNSAGEPAAQTSGGLHSRMTKSASSTRSIKAQAMNFTKSAPEPNDAGITVAGSESNQSFQWSAGFPTHSQSEVIVLRLRGAVGGQRVVKAITVKTKPTCATCGKKNRATVKFCAECGTALSLI